MEKFASIFIEIHFRSYPETQLSTVYKTSNALYPS